MSPYSQNKNANMPFLSSNPEQAMREAIQSIEVLQDVYKRETSALKQADMKEFAAIQNEKLEAAKYYQRSVEDIVRRKDEMKSINPAFKEKLKSMQNNFAVLAQRNMDALSRTQRNLQRVGETIQRAAKEAVRKNSTTPYGQHGKLEVQSKRALSTGISETA
jgi:DNA uptake protein ComE-like DNA-binding protein